MFRKLCGTESMNNTLLVTNVWGKVEPGEGEQRERELCSEGTFWSAMVAQGAKVERHDDTRRTALRLVESPLEKTPVALNIQKQLVDDGKTLIDTDAGADVNAELLKMEKKHEEELEALQDEMNRAMKTSKLERIFWCMDGN